MLYLTSDKFVVCASIVFNSSSHICRTHPTSHLYSHSFWSHWVRLSISFTVFVSRGGRAFGRSARSKRGRGGHYERAVLRRTAADLRLSSSLFKFHTDNSLATIGSTDIYGTAFDSSRRGRTSQSHSPKTRPTLPKKM